MLKALRPSLRALLIHLVAVTLVFGYRVYLADQQQPPGLLALAVSEGVIAASLGLLTGLRAWWLAINLLFFPLLALAASYAINPLWYLVVFVVIWLLNWNAFGEQVPLYLSGNKTIEVLARQLDADKPFAFADFGCGWASVLVKLAKQFPHAHFVGYETAPLSYLVAKVRSAGINNLDIKRQSFWQTPWKQHDVIYCFLSPAPMSDIEARAENDFKPGATLISNSFSLPNKVPHRIVNVGDLRKTQLFIYRY